MLYGGFMSILESIKNIDTNIVYRDLQADSQEFLTEKKIQSDTLTDIAKSNSFFSKENKDFFKETTKTAFQ